MIQRVVVILSLQIQWEKYFSELLFEFIIFIRKLSIINFHDYNMWNTNFAHKYKSLTTTNKYTDASGKHHLQVLSLNNPIRTIHDQQDPFDCITFGPICPIDQVSMQLGVLPKIENQYSFDKWLMNFYIPSCRSVLNALMVTFIKTKRTTIIMTWVASIDCIANKNVYMFALISLNM